MKKIIEYELPAYWASALINKDWSGIELDGEWAVNEVKHWLDRNPQANIVMCNGNNFIGRYNRVDRDMLVYTSLEG